MRPQRRQQPASHYLRGVMVALALVLPTLSLAVLGTVWLWQNNGLIIWGVAASAVALLIYGAEYWLIRREEQEPTSGKTLSGETSCEGSARSPREEAAWQAIEQLSRDIKPETLNSRDAIMALGVETVDTVARHMHPGEKNPVWKFTVPEALALVSRVSNEMQRFVVDSVPLGDRLTVGQALNLYRWRGFVGVAEKAYDLYRILRFINPATAVAGELREKVSGQLLDGMRSELTRRIARAYVREVGQAAIDLYSGRLRPDLIDSAGGGNVEAATATANSQPLKIALIGQAGVGKSSLINALSQEIRAAVDVVPTTDKAITYALSHGDDALTVLTDTPGLNATADRRTELMKHADGADVIVWLLSAIRPDRAADAELLAAFRDSFETRHDRRPPPIIFLLTHVDRVRPFGEWQPPYDLGDHEQPKSRSIRDAVTAVAEDLGVRHQDIIPVALGRDASNYNIDVVWSRLIDMFDDARNVQLLRRLSEGARVPITKSLWRQAVGAGRVIRAIATK